MPADTTVDRSLYPFLAPYYPYMAQLSLADRVRALRDTPWEKGVSPAERVQKIEVKLAEADHNRKVIEAAVAEVDNPSTEPGMSEAQNIVHEAKLAAPWALRTAIKFSKKAREKTTRGEQ